MSENIEASVEVEEGDLEASFRAQLATLQVRSDEEIEAQKADDHRQRVAALRRAACLPTRANAFCKQREMRDQNREWWKDGSPWAQCLERVIEASQNRGAVIGILGPQGRGKTTLAVALAREFTANERSVRWCDMVGFIMAMQDAKGGSYQQKEFREWESPDLLVIDHLHQMPSVDWESRLFFKLLDQRYNDMRTTVLLGNVASRDPKMWASEMMERVGASIWDRVRETGVIEAMVWPDLRPDRDVEGGTK